MDWEDCVVDVHSVKLSKTVLEIMFKKCGTVRSIIHWKGQGEKPHVFFEYKSPTSADSARAVGLERSDLQVIKISNNEMLKRKFRELAHGPLRERDQRCRPTGPSPRSTYAHFNRDFGSSTATGKDHRLPDRPHEHITYASERDVWGRYEAARHDHDRGGTRDHGVQHRSSNSTSIASSSSNSLDRYSKRDFRVSAESGQLETPLTSKSIPLTPSVGISASHDTRPQSQNKPPAVLKIPHAGEVIKFDLDTQLEENPTGIIRILSAVKADQKLWMITAAYYKGKHNLESAKKVLEAGIDMAVQVGEEADTKPFWHLLGQINSIIQAHSSPVTSAAFTLSPMTTSFSSAETSSSDNMDQAFIQSDLHQPKSPSKRDIPGLPTISHKPTTPISPVKATSSNPRNSPAGKPPALACVTESTLPSHPRPTGPRKREVHPAPPTPTSPIPASGPMGTPSQLHNLQSEIGALRDKQNAVLEDLSFARAAKRRAEDEAKEERSVRRKLEKHLRVAEDALARSKRMEDAALDQVKREVEARRRAESLLADLKARKEVEPPAAETGHSLFTSNSNDAAVLFQLASMIRGVPSNDHANVMPFGSGVSMTSSAHHVNDRTMNSQPGT